MDVVTQIVCFRIVNVKVVPHDGQAESLIRWFLQLASLGCPGRKRDLWILTWRRPTIGEASQPDDGKGVVGLCSRTCGHCVKVEWLMKT